MSFYNSPFRLIDDLMQLPPFGTDVYVISDEKYREIRQNQARDEIAVLQKRLEAYEKAADGLRDTIVELQTEYKLLPAEDKE